MPVPGWFQVKPTNGNGPKGLSWGPLYEAPMIKKLSAVGNSLGLIIERPILELLDITKDTALEIKTDGEALIIRPVKLSKKERIRESTKRMIVGHDETLRKLAK